MVKLQETFGNLIFLGLFVASFIGFIIVLQADNDAAQPLVENELFNASFIDLERSLTALEESSQVQYDQFSEETPQPGFISIVLFGIVAAGKNFSNIALSTFLIIIKLPLLVLGLPSTLFSTVVAWLVIVLIIGAWVLYKAGG